MEWVATCRQELLKLINGRRVVVRSYGNALCIDNLGGPGVFFPHHPGLVGTNKEGFRGNGRHKIEIPNA